MKGCSSRPHQEENGVGSKVVLEENIELECEAREDEEDDGDDVGDHVGDKPGRPVDPVLVNVRQRRADMVDFYCVGGLRIRNKVKMKI